MRPVFTEQQEANFIALRDCPSPVHSFHRLGYGDSNLRIMRCVHCGGLVGQNSGRWFQRGIIAHSTHPILAIASVAPWMISERSKDIARIEALTVRPDPMPLPDSLFLSSLLPQTRGVPAAPWPPAPAGGTDE